MKWSAMGFVSRSEAASLRARLSFARSQAFSRFGAAAFRLPGRVAEWSRSGRQALDALRALASAL